jgi:high affinity sulfate transporter 1
MIVQARAWLAAYDRTSLRPDIVAGITLAAYLLPAAIGDASLAGLPPQAGLYSCMCAGLVFWIFCSSRQTVVSVTSALSMLVGATLGGMAGGDPSRMLVLAACTALMVAAIAFVGYAIRAGTAVNFFSETVMVGFKCGLAFYLASTQLPKLFGFSGSHGDFWQNMGHFLHNLDKTNATSLTLGLTALALLAAGKALFANRPVALFVLIGSIASAGIFGLAQRGVALLGPVPQGLPLPSLPIVSRHDINELLPLSLACFLIAAVETSAIGRMFAAKYGYRLDATQEFLAIGSANLMSGLAGGFPVSGGSSQSLVNETAGARTPMSGLVAALITLFVVLFLTGLLHDLPQPALAAIVLMAVSGLIDVKKLREIWHFSRVDFAVAMATVLGVLGAGLLDGVLIGVAISILLLINRAAHPHVIEVGRVPATSYFADLTRHPENTRVPGVLVVRPEGSIVYFNVDHVRDRLTELVTGCSEPPRLVVLLLSNVPFVDLSGAEALLKLHSTLASRGILLRFAEARSAVRDALRRASANVPDELIAANQTVFDVLRAAHMDPAA